MRAALLAAALALPAPAVAGDWQAMSGAEIRDALSGATVIYPGEQPARQVFHESGRTLYDAGRPDWGTWRVEGDRYCSQWPPAPQWACYEMTSDGAGGVRFISEGGAVSEGRIAR